MNRFILMLILLTFACVTAFALDSNKPESHNQAWELLHGKKAAVSDRECMDCHAERLECIACHEDVKPRSHNATWTMKAHGMESRWARSSCKTCHTEDSCVECHEVSEPMSHRVPGFGPSTSDGAGGVHCQTSCNLGIGRWTATMSKDCLICHKTQPTANHPTSR